MQLTAHQMPFTLAQSNSAKKMSKEQPSRAAMDASEPISPDTPESVEPDLNESDSAPEQTVEEARATYGETTDAYWHFLFLTCQHANSHLNGADFARKLLIPLQYVKVYAAGRRRINFQTRLVLLDMLDIPWTAPLMLMALDDSSAAAIFEHLCIQNGRGYYKVSGNFSSIPSFWRQLIEFVSDQTHLTKHIDIASKIKVQPPTFSAFIANRADLRPEQKVQIFEEAKIRIDHNTFDAIIPKKLANTFTSKELYVRFKTAIIEGHDIGPKMTYVYGPSTCPSNKATLIRQNDKN